MLYDPKWSVVADETYTLRDLIAWLETKSPQTTYNFQDCSGGCLLGQYVTERTGSYNCEKYMLASDLDKKNSDLGGQIAINKPHTFGAALERARAA
jgi:hypothetical protein